MTKPTTSEEPVYKRDTATLEHNIGCPAERIETFEAKAPNGDTFLVTRCLDCGVQTEAIVAKAAS